MNCPECGSVLVAEKFELCPYETCPKCRGLWIEAARVRSMAIRMGWEMDPKSSRMFSMWPRVLNAADLIGRLRICPRCQKPMKQFLFAYETQVHVDRCDPCDGIWLDGKELRGIAQFVRAEPKTQMTGSQWIKESQKSEPNSYPLDSTIRAILFLVRWWF